MGPVTEHGILRYALPVGWQVTTERGAGVSNVTAEEPRQRGRTLEVIVVPRSPRRSNAPGLISALLRNQIEGEPIDFLGEEGVLVEARLLLPSPDDGEDGQTAARIALSAAQVSGLYAAVVLRDGTGVAVSLRGESAFGPSSRKLIKEVVGAMQLVPNAGGTPISTTVSRPDEGEDAGPVDPELK